MSAKSRLLSVRTFFEQPQHYFHKDYHVTVRAEIVREMIPDAADLSIFDIGCGDGRVSLQFLPQAGQVTLLDISETMLRRARAKVPAECANQTNFFKGDFMDYSPATSADVVICLGVLAHVERVESAVQKLASLTRVGGRCIVQITDCERVMGKVQHLSVRSLFGRPQARSYRLQRTRFREIESIAAAAGFSFVRRRDHALIFPGMGRLPNHWLFRYDRFVLKHRFLERFASSSVLLFERVDCPSAGPSTKDRPV